MSGNTGTTALEQIMLSLIDEVQQTHRAAGKAPDYATLQELTNGLKVEMMEALRSLYRRGDIEFHHTVNGIKMFNLTHPIDNPQ